METIEIKTQQMLAASQLGFGDDTDTVVGMDAPEFNIWED